MNSARLHSLFFLQILPVLIALLPLLAAAQAPGNYPSRPVTIVLNSASGTAGDTTARLMQGRLTERLKQPVLVENRVGASGIIGADYVAKAASDGHTLLLMSNTSSILSAARTDLPFDLLNDFAHIAKLIDVPLALGIPITVKANSLQELLAQIKANPGKYTFASPGTTGPQHLIGELMKQSLGLDMVHVPHKDHALAVQNLVGGHVDLMVTSVSSLLPLANAGKLKLLGITGAKRSALAPNLPTFKELGYGFLVDMAGWYVLSAPAKTPGPIVARLNREFREVIATREIVEALARNGLDSDAGTPEQAVAFLKGDIERWSRVIKQGNIRTN